MAYGSMGGGSCSAFIHLIAGHPGIALVLAGSLLVGSPVGEQCHANRAQIEQEAKRYVAEVPSLITRVNEVNQAFARVEHLPLSDESLKYALLMLNCDCDKGTVPDTIRDDQALLRDISYVFFADLVRKYGVSEAIRRYK
jgi:hypothetical protein